MKEISIAQKVRGLKIGRHFYVKTIADRQKVLRVAKALRDSGAIEFTVVTREEAEGFKIGAI
jgi:hypothetical protein